MQMYLVHSSYINLMNCMTIVFIECRNKFILKGANQCHLGFHLLYWNVSTEKTNFRRDLFKNQQSSILRLTRNTEISWILYYVWQNKIIILTYLIKIKNNVKNTLKVLNSIIRSKTKHCSKKFVSENVTYTCPIQIATEFNKYFANIGPSLASTIHHSGKDYSSYLHERNSKTCFFIPTIIKCK